LADLSPSMMTQDGGSREGKTRFALLQEALQGLPPSVTLIGFSDSANVLAGAEALRVNMQGTTALHLAIEKAVPFEPIRTIVVCDGEVDDEGRATVAAEKLTGVIDTIYAGNPANVQARAFLESLARAGAGSHYQAGDQVDIAKQLPAVIAGLLKG
jgi:hypothetical protein